MWWTLAEFEERILRERNIPRKELGEIKCIFFHSKRLLYLFFIYYFFMFLWWYMLYIKKIAVKKIMQQL